MATNDPATILLSGLDWSIKHEAISDAVVTPGMLLDVTLGIVGPHGTASGFSQKIFARRDLSNAGGIDTDYASGDLVRYGQARSGDIVNCIVNPTFDTTVDVSVVSDGIGGVKVVAAEEEDVFIGRALETVADPVTGFSRAKVEIY